MIVGIDLGTTHCSVSFVDGEVIRPFSILQLTAPGVWDALPQLPSFLYLANEGELPQGSLTAPWESEESFEVCGQLARERGAHRPDQLIHSAKSWLTSAGSSRKEKILPLGAPARSPLEASCAYLRHIRKSWDWAMAKGDPSRALEEQDVVLTIPASFDEVARRLTVEAARLAGLRRVTLLEEPQAAFYSWMMDQKKGALPVGSTVVVCDVGGGTTDFSAIEVEEKGFVRTAVGRHLLLGGDNMDLAIAHLVEGDLGDLDSSQWLSLVQQARRVKEGAEPTFVIEGRGSSLVGGARTATLRAERIDELLVGGFFGRFDWAEAANVRRGSALRAGGLPYEAEPSIVKQLAHFLQTSDLRPTHILFNGGVMHSPGFVEAVMDNLRSWFGEVEMLLGARLDHAVARGAAYFGRAREGEGSRICGGAARATYIELEVDGARKAMTLLARGSEGGARFEPEQIFHLKAGEPVSFQLYTSQSRLGDQPGELVEIDEEQLMALPPLSTQLRYGKKKGQEVTVRLLAELTEIGTVELSLRSTVSDHLWQLDFQIADGGVAAGRMQEEMICAEQIEQARDLLTEGWLSGDEQLLSKVEELTGTPRLEWPPNLLRPLWDSVFDLAEERKRSVAREKRWWNLIGFLLRPGVGSALDPFRVRRLWQLILSEMREPLREEVEVQRVIAYRRISAALSQGQQLQLASQLTSKKGGKFLQAERQRTLASFELAPIRLKEQLGSEWLGQILEGKGSDVHKWALARLATRLPLYGSVGHVVPSKTCAAWLEQLLASDQFDPDLARRMARRSAVREHDVPHQLLRELAERTGDATLLEVAERTDAEKRALLGDSLPAGLRL